MNYTKEKQIKCSIEQHDRFLQYICFNQSCKENRVYCFQCFRDGSHCGHPKDQYELNKLIEFCKKIEVECEDLIQRLCLTIQNINELFISLNQGLRKKYQLSEESIFKLDAKQLNQAIGEMFKYNEITNTLLTDIENYSDNMVIQLNKQIIELKLEQLTYYQLTQQELEQAEQLYQNGYTLFYEEKFEEAIKLLDNALLINPSHLLSLYTKAESLRMLNDYHEAIIWADKALSIDSAHANSLYTKASSLCMLNDYKEAIKWADKSHYTQQVQALQKNQLAESLRMLDNYEEAIFWADKALSIDSMHVSSLYTKADSLKMLNNYKEAIKCADKALSINSEHINSLQTKAESLRLLGNQVEALQILEQVLEINPNFALTLASKGACLQELSCYQEAILYYNKAIKINPNYVWAKNKKSTYLKVYRELNVKKYQAPERENDYSQYNYLIYIINNGKTSEHSISIDYNFIQKESLKYNFYNNSYYQQLNFWYFPLLFIY